MEAFVLSLGLCSAVMSVIALLNFALCSALKNVWSAKRRYIMWIVVFIGFLTPAKPRFGEPVYAVSPSDLPQPDVLISSSAAFSENMIYMLLFAVWLAGFLGCIAFYALKQHRFNSFAKRFSYLCSDRVLLTARAVCRELGVRDVRVCILPGLPSPMLTGLLSPTVLLSKEDYSDEELRLILKHELTHFKQRDLFIKLFVLICRSVHWFNPLMPLFIKSVDKMCELSCDARVLQGEGREEKKIYCKAIISAVSSENLSSFSASPAVAGTFGHSGLNLKYRLSLIVSPSAKKKLGVLCVFLCGLTLFSGAVFGVSYDTGAPWLEETTLTQEIVSESQSVTQHGFEFDGEARETSTMINFEGETDLSVEISTDNLEEQYSSTHHEGLFFDVSDLSGLVEKTTVVSDDYDD